MSSEVPGVTCGRHQNGSQTPEENPSKRPWRSRRVAERQRSDENKQNSSPVDGPTSSDPLSTSRNPLSDITNEVNHLSVDQGSQSREHNNGSQRTVLESDTCPVPAAELTPKAPVDENSFTVVQSRSQNRAAKTRQSAVSPCSNDHVAPHISVPRTRAARRNGPAPSGPRTHDNGVLYSEQRSGIIFQHRDTRPCRDPKAKAGDPGIVVSPDGTLWTEKTRGFLDLALHGESVLEYAIYSNNDNGLANKPAECRGEYLSLQPFGVADEDFVNQSPGNSVLKIGTEFVENYLTRKTMVVKFTEVLTRPINCKELLKVAELEPESTEILKAYAVKAVMG